MPEAKKSLSIPQWVIYAMLIAGGGGTGTIGTKLVDGFVAEAAPVINTELIEHRLGNIEAALTELEAALDDIETCCDE